MKILAVDPGSRYCAIVVRDTTVDDPLAVRVAERDRPSTPGVALWIRHVATEIALLAREHRPDVVAVENAVAPNPHVGMTDPGPIIETAAIVGAVLVTYPNSVAIDPDGFGAPMPNRRVLTAAYPAALVGPRETTGSGKGRMQHARAAWDLAAAAARATRYRLPWTPPEFDPADVSCRDDCPVCYGDGWLRPESGGPLVPCPEVA